MSIIESSALLYNAIEAWRIDPQHAGEHLEVALRRAGDLQRALLLEKINHEKGEA